MKMLRNKKTVQKMIISLIILILFNFIFPVYSNASWWGGGTLFDPIRFLICGIGDSIMNFMQASLLPGSPAAVDHISPAKLMEQMYRASGKTAEADEIANSIDRSEWGFGLVGWLADSGWGVFKGTANGFYEERDIPVIIYSPAAIFSNLVPALDVNFINPTVTYTGGTVKYTPEYDSSRRTWQINAHYEKDTSMSEEDKMKQNTAYQLQGTIATWYKALRNIAIVGMLSVLVYVAIRIILSTTAGETAKYKTMLKDWVFALCILFFMHYMMAFLLKTTEMLTDLFSSGDIIAVREEAETRIDRLKVDTFMSTAREMAKSDTSEIDVLGLPVGETSFAYTLMYAILIFYTAIFTWKYLKRFIYLAFLTMISPLVALTYPIDKIKDGSAQAFNKWFTEYLFNVLIQPIHLLLYTILISSAKSFASTNLIYSVVAIGFMLEAENIVKDFFGIKAQRGEGEKAITGGIMFGAATSLVKNGFGLLSGGSGDSKTSGGGSGKNKPRYEDRDADSDGTKPFQAFMNDDGLNGDGSEDASPGGNNPPNNPPVNPPNNPPVNPPVNPPNNPPVNPPVNPPNNPLPRNNGTNVNPDYRTDFWGNRANQRAEKRKRKQQEKQRKINIRRNNRAKRFPKLKNFGRGLSDAIRYAGSSTPLKPLRFSASVIGGVASTSGRLVARNGKKMARFAARAAVKGVGAATLGTIGLAAGLASADDSDIWKYVGVGTGAGLALGNRVLNGGSTVLGVGSELKNNIEQKYYGDEYEEKVLNPRLDKEWRKDQEVRTYYRRKYGSHWRKAIKDSEELRKSGITDQDDIDAALKLYNKNDGMTVEKAAEIIQFTKGLNRANMFNPSVYKDMQARVLRGVNGNEAKAAKIMDLINQRFKLEASDVRRINSNDDEEQNS